MTTRFVFALLIKFAALPAAADEPPTTTFKDQTAALGLKISNSAACWADFNNDGFVDLCAGGVWINQKGKQFKKLADVSGSCVAADFDNDGFVDLFSWSNLKLYRNQSGKGFVEVELPKLPPTSSRGACWGDFNGDGFVDLFVGGYENWPKQITYPYLILLNQRGKSFKLMHSAKRYRARGVTACDFDRNGTLDIYVSNYRLQPNLLWVNDGKATFRESAKKHGVVAGGGRFSGGHSIGAAWGDFNNDGHIDLFAGNFAHRDARGNQPQSRFLHNLGPKKGHLFRDRGTGGVFYQESYASPVVGDYDNDARLDLFFTTVYATASFGRKNNAVLYRNFGTFAFTDMTATAKLPKLPPTYQAAFADIDNDGDLDLVSAGKLFVNQGTGRHWIKIRLIGDGKMVNTSAIGAQVRIKLGSETLTRHVEAGTGEGNQNDLTLHFGLGGHKGTVDLKIDWPNGKRQAVKGVRADRTFVVKYGEDR